MRRPGAELGRIRRRAPQRPKTPPGPPSLGASPRPIARCHPPLPARARARVAQERPWSPPLAPIQTQAPQSVHWHNTQLTSNHCAATPPCARASWGGQLCGSHRGRTEALHPHRFSGFDARGPREAGRGRVTQKLPNVLSNFDETNLARVRLTLVILARQRPSWPHFVQVGQVRQMLPEFDRCWPWFAIWDNTGLISTTVGRVWQLFGLNLANIRPTWSNMV